MVESPVVVGGPAVVVVVGPGGGATVVVVGPLVEVDGLPPPVQTSISLTVKAIKSGTCDEKLI